MNFRQLIVASVVFMTALSSQAAFVPNMNSGQARAEIAANALAAGLNMSSLLSVLVAVPGINLAAAAVTAVAEAQSS